MSKALYRKYRSRKLSEIVGQEHITQTLDNAIKNNKISHAYLFTGPRGVGKTSIARILAHEINEIPYSDESINLDIIEIDAASNRRIDEIRDLRDKVHIAPTSSRYKVYIIDEVHMLTREAFNALLKTLEEPPKHVIFILATTEINKLPETIVSRTQRFTFKSIDEDLAVKHLASIAKSESIDIDKEALSLLAIHGGGSFRDSISLLDQVASSGKKISKKEVESLIGIAANQHIDNLLEQTLHGKPSGIDESLDDIVADGIGAAQVAKQLSAKLRSKIIAGEEDSVSLDLLSDLLTVTSSIEPAGSLEVALFKANLSLNKQQPVLAKKEFIEPSVVKEVTKKAPEKKTIAEIKPEPSPKIEQKEDKPEIELVKNPVKVAKINTEESDEWWEDVLLHIKKTNNTLYGVLRMAETRISSNSIDLVFKFIFHKNKVSDPVTQSKIHSSIEEITGKNFQINPIHDKDLAETIKAKPKGIIKEPEPINSVNSEPEHEPENNEELASITNIFGGGEVLES